MSKLKVLYICPNGYMGGAERFVCNAARGHSESSKIRLTVFFFTDGEAVDECNRLGIETHVLPFTFRMRNLGKLLKAILYLRVFINDGAFNIVHSTMPYAHLMACFATLFSPIKRIWFQHGPVGGTLDKLANLFHVDRIYFNSKYLESEHLKMSLSSRNTSKHKFINYGILENKASDTEVEKISSELRTFSEQKLFLSAGRLCSWKGQDNLITAFLAASQKDSDFCNKAKLVIIGSAQTDRDKAFAKKLFDLVRENKAEDKVLFLGHQKNIQNYYHACDIFVHTSTIPEPFGLVVAEAMKNRCLVIGSNVGGVTDILKNRETGFSFDSTSSNATESLIPVLLETFAKSREQNLIDPIKENACKIIESNYSIKQMTDALESDYEILC